MDGLVLLYRPACKLTEIDTQYGILAYIEWLRKEKTRIERTPGRVAEIEESGNKASLWVNDVVGDRRYRGKKI